MKNDVYQEYKEVHYKMWDWIAKQVKHAEAIDGGLRLVHQYKHLWLLENGYASQDILFDCFACTVCKQNCNECPLKDILKGCYDVWTDDVVPSFQDDEYAAAYDWAIKIRDGWKEV